jgi:hypothetical protein
MATSRKTPAKPKTPPRSDATQRPARRKSDATTPGERRGTLRELDDRVESNDDSALESLGKAMTSPVVEAANEEESKS